MSINLHSGSQHRVTDEKSQQIQIGKIGKQKPQKAAAKTTRKHRTSARVNTKDHENPARIVRYSRQDDADLLKRQVKDFSKQQAHRKAREAGPKSRATSLICIFDKWQFPNNGIEI